MGHQSFQPDEIKGIGGLTRGDFLFLGVVAGLYVTTILAMTVLIVTAAPDAPAAASLDTTVAGPTSGNATAGAEIFASVCSACHGPTGEGIPGLGPSFVGNAFIAGRADDELVGFLTVGRPADDPANTTGVAMPPKGGNPSLSDDDLHDIVAFLRTLN